LASYVHGSKEGLVYIAAFDGDQIIGLQELQKDPNQENVYWMTFTEVDSDHRGQRVASKLKEETYRLAKERGYVLEESSYTEAGWERLRDLNARLAEKYGVKLIDRQRRI
ncbi:MAG: GNAT family N-acetyltransferase, partial [Patescibacteria group bacterium]|nr:GNAT family N-acetyltransferase [Patescibacteria group bacterium]